MVEELEHELVEEKKENKELKNKMRKSGRFLNIIMDLFSNLFGGGGGAAGGGGGDGGGGFQFTDLLG